MRRQFFELRPGQTLTIGGARVTLEAKTGQRARLKVESDSPTQLERPDAPSVERPQAAPDAAVAPLSRPRFGE